VDGFIRGNVFLADQPDPAARDAADALERELDPFLKPQDGPREPLPKKQDEGQKRQGQDKIDGGHRPYQNKSYHNKHFLSVFAFSVT
jgi:hypothetical protein